MVSICPTSMGALLWPRHQVNLKHTVKWWAVLVLWCTQTRSDACAVEANGTALLCRYCGHEVAAAEDMNSVPSPVALSHRNASLLGDKLLHIQLLQNSHGHQFEVITFRTADVAKRWPAEGGFSWFPGFTWTIASCPRCGAHLGKSEPHSDPMTAGPLKSYPDTGNSLTALLSSAGWGFQPSEWPLTVPDSRFDNSERTFVALITDSLLEDIAPSLLIPKSFSS